MLTFPSSSRIEPIIIVYLKSESPDSRRQNKSGGIWAEYGEGETGQCKV